MRTTLKNLGTLGIIGILSIACLLPVIVLVPACTTTQQRVAVNTIGSIETSATAGMDGYLLSVAEGKTKTNSVPKVSRAYNSLQQSIKLSLDVVQNNTNALAPSSLVNESTDFANLIIQVKGK